MTGIIEVWICNVHESGHSNRPLISLFEIIEEKGKSTLTYQEPVPWQSVPVTVVGVCSESSSPPVCPLAFDDFNGDCWPFRTGLWIQGLGRLLIILGLHTSIRNIWIREKSLEDELCKGQTQSLQCTMSGHCMLEKCCCFWQFGESHLLIIVIGQSRATLTGFTTLLLILKKGSV